MYQLASAWRGVEQGTAGARAPHTAGRWVPPESAPPAGRRLRIGYVSPDLREHAIGSLTAELFALHDRARVEVFAYYSDVQGPDTFRVRIRDTVDHWIDVAGRGRQARRTGGS